MSEEQAPLPSELAPELTPETPIAEEITSQEHTYLFDVKMTCTGCSGAVERALGRWTDKGVNSFTVDLPTQKVTVVGTMPFEEVRQKIAKTGKEVLSGEIVE